MVEAINQNNVAEICKSFAASMKSIKGIDEKDIKKSMHAFSSSANYIIEFYKISEKITSTISSKSNVLDTQIIVAQKSLADSIASIIKTISEFNKIEFPSMFSMKLNIVRFKFEVNQLIDMFIGRGGVIESLNQFTELSRNKVIETYDENGKLLKKTEVAGVSFNKIFDSFKEVFDSLSEMIENTKKLNINSIRVGLLINNTRSELFGIEGKRKGIFDLYLDMVFSEKLKPLQYKKTQTLINNLLDNIAAVNQLIPRIITDAKIKNIVLLKIYNNQIIPLLKESILKIESLLSINNINSNNEIIEYITSTVNLINIISDSARSIDIEDLKNYNSLVLPLISSIIYNLSKLVLDRKENPYEFNQSIILSINSYVNDINQLIESISEIGIRNLIKVAIAAKVIEKLVEYIKTIIFTLDKFANEMKGKKFANINESTKKINAIINNFLSIIGGIIVLALASVPLLLAIPFAISAVLLIGIFIKTITWILNGVIRKEVIKNITLSTIRLAIIITAILFMITAVLGMFILITLSLPILAKSAAGTILAMLIISAVVLGIAGLAMLINKIFAAGINKIVYQGLLLMITLIGVMLIATGMIMLLGLAGILFFKDNFWLIALGMFAIVGAVTLAIAGLGYLIAAMVPGIALFTTGIVLVLISITAMLLIGVELLLLAKFKFDDSQRQAIKETTATIIGTVHDVLDALFNGISEDEINRSKQGAFSRFFRSIFKGPAFVIEALATSLTLILTFVSVTMLLIIGLELKLLVHYNIDKDAIEKNVNTIMGAANACIDAIFQPNDKQQEESGGRFGKALKHLFVGAAEVLSLIMGIGKLALVMVAILLIKLVSLELKLIANNDLDASKVKTNINTIMGAANACIDAIFQPNDKQPEGSGSRFLGALGHFFVGLTDMLQLIASIGKLSLMMVTFGLLKLLTNQLISISNLDTSSFSNISEKVQSIMSAAQTCIDAIFQPNDKQQEESGTWLGGIIKKVFKGYGDTLTTILSIGKLSLMLAAIGMIKVVVEHLNEIVNISFTEGIVRKKVETIIGSANVCIDSVFGEDDNIVKEYLKYKKDIKELENVSDFIRILNKQLTVLSKELVKINDITNSILGITPATSDESSLTTIVNTILAPVNTLQSTTIEFSFTGKIGRLAGFESLKNTLIQINDITNSILGITPATSDESSLTTIVNTILAPLDVLQLNELLLNDTKLNFFLIQQEGQLNSIAKSFERVISSFILINNAFNKLNSVGVDESNSTVTDRILTNIKSVADHQFDSRNFNLNIDAFNKLADSVSKFYNINDSKNTKFKEGVDKAIEFTNTINNAKLDNLQTATNLFGKMTEFSNTINGNFEGLADTINDKIMPLLEKLNDALKETNEGIKNGAFNRPIVEGSYEGGGSSNPTDTKGNPIVGQAVNRPKDYSAALSGISTNIVDITKEVEKLRKMFEPNNKATVATVKML